MPKSNNLKNLSESVNKYNKLLTNSNEINYFNYNQPYFQENLPTLPPAEKIRRQQTTHETDESSEFVNILSPATEEELQNPSWKSLKLLDQNNENIQFFNKDFEYATNNIIPNNLSCLKNNNKCLFTNIYTIKEKMTMMIWGLQILIAHLEQEQVILMKKIIKK